MSISVLDISKQLLDMKKILYLPKTKIVIDENLFNIYLNLIDHKTLLKISEENNLSNLQIIKDLFNSKGLNKSVDLNIDLNKYNNINGLSPIVDELVNSLKSKHDVLKNKTRDYLPNDLNIIQNEFVGVNKENIKLRNQINEYDTFYDKYEQLLKKYNIFNFDININIIDNVIETTQITN